MIFVTVGTHEQQFNRLVEYMDKWAKDNDEEVVIQSGFSTYNPKFCKWKKLYSYKEMNELVNQARIVITHGGPASFISSLQVGKIPIVVPRKKEFEEHVNDHQVSFCKFVKERYNNIIYVDDILELKKYISDYEKLVKTTTSKMNGNNENFNKKLTEIIEEML